jgi:hypothetical protein
MTWWAILRPLVGEIVQLKPYCIWLVVKGDAQNKAQTRRRKFGIAKRSCGPHHTAADRRRLWPVIGRQGPILITPSVYHNGRLSFSSALLFVLIACTNSTCLNLKHICLQLIASSRAKAAGSRRVNRLRPSGVSRRLQEITLPHYRGTPILETDLQQNVFLCKQYLTTRKQLI